MKFEGEVKFCQILNPKIVRLDKFRECKCRFYTNFLLKELTTEELTDSSWNMLENIKRPHERDVLNLKRCWIRC